jgi:hypothetical protein
LGDREGEAADVTLSAEELDGAGDAGCVLQAHLARLPRGGVLELQGGGPPAGGRWRERCQALGYHVAAGAAGSLLVGKGGRRPGAADPDGHRWSVRGHSTDGRQTRLHAGRHSFSVGPAVSLGPDEPLPSAIEHLLAALAADLISSFAACAAERAVAVDAVECRLSARLDDPLASIGVVGAEGSPALAAVTGTVYVSADAEEAVLRGAWCAALRRSPLFNTLATGASLQIEMRAEP